MEWSFLTQTAEEISDAVSQQVKKLIERLPQDRKLSKMLKKTEVRLNELRQAQ